MRPNDTSINTLLPFSTEPALRRRFMVVDEPIQGNLRFGLTLELLDKLAEETALAGRNARTVGTEKRRHPSFAEPVHEIALAWLMTLTASAESRGRPGWSPGRASAR